MPRRKEASVWPGGEWSTSPAVIMQVGEERVGWAGRALWESLQKPQLPTFSPLQQCHDLSRSCSSANVFSPKPSSPSPSSPTSVFQCMLQVPWAQVTGHCQKPSQDFWTNLCSGRHRGYLCYLDVPFSLVLGRVGWVGRQAELGKHVQDNERQTQQWA